MPIRPKKRLHILQRRVYRIHCGSQTSSYYRNVINAALEQYPRWLLWNIQVSVQLEWFVSLLFFKSFSFLINAHTHRFATNLHNRRRRLGTRCIHPQPQRFHHHGTIRRWLPTSPRSMRCRLKLHTKLQRHWILPILANLHGPRIRSQAPPIPIRRLSPRPTIPVISNPKYATHTVATERNTFHSQLAAAHRRTYVTRTGWFRCQCRSKTPLESQCSHSRWCGFDWCPVVGCIERAPPVFFFSLFHHDTILLFNSSLKPQYSYSHPPILLLVPFFFSTPLVGYHSSWHASCTQTNALVNFLLLRRNSVGSLNGIPPTQHTRFPP